MTRRAWVRLDNASNVFLAARSDSDPKVFRLSAELDRDVDSGILQAALDETFDRYPLYHAVLRRGVFWYYLQDSDLRPEVRPEVLPPCAPLYGHGRIALLFRVVHHRRRIHLEVLHALSDGAGALAFLTDLLDAYARRLEGDEGGGARTTAGAAVHEDDHTVSRGLHTDSFRRYFRHPRRRDRSFESAAAPAVLDPALDRGAEGPGADDPGAEDRDAAESAAPSPTASDRSKPATGRSTPRTRVHRMRGTLTPDRRPRAIELTMPAADVLALARGEGVSLTMYLTACFFESVRRAAEGRGGAGLGRARTLAVSVPVNLRQFFPSDSPRNFFATVRLAHTYGAPVAGGTIPDSTDPDSVGAVARSLEAAFRPQIAPAALEAKLRGYIRLERSWFLRAIPRPVKDLILRAANAATNRGLTVAISNLGRVALPEPAARHVGRVAFQVSAARPQFCAISHAGILTVTFTSPFVETDHVREFARLLGGQGVPVTVGAVHATEAEVSRAESTHVGDRLHPPAGGRA